MLYILCGVLGTGSDSALFYQSWLECLLRESGWTALDLWKPVQNLDCKAKELNESKSDEKTTHPTQSVAQYNSPPYKHDLGGHPNQLVEDILNLDGPDPLPGSHERRLFVSNIHQSLCGNQPPDRRKVRWSSWLREHFHALRTKPVPVESPCVWGQISPRSLAAWTRNRWSEGIGKHSPSRCRQCGPACSGGNCRCLGPRTPWENTSVRVQQNSSSALKKRHQFVMCLYFAI